jgi:5-methylthioadenosine/S-adenosylhomocysteine deaminase
MPAHKVLEMDPMDAARCQREIGSLKPGKRADLILLEPRYPGSLPLHDPIAGVVSAVRSANVKATTCDGIWLMRDRRLLTLDGSATLAEAPRAAAVVRERCGIWLTDRFPAVHGAGGAAPVPAT